MGIGSKIKERIRKIIPNEAAELAVKAAPIVGMIPGWGPIAAAAMSGIGGFDKTGRIGQSLKNAAKSYALGKVSQAITGQITGSPDIGIKSLMPGSGYWTDVGFNPANILPGGAGLMEGYTPYSLSGAGIPEATVINAADPIKSIDPRADAYGDIEGYRSTYKPEGLKGSIPPGERFGYTGTTDRVTDTLYDGDTAKRYEEGHFYSPERVELEGSYYDLMHSQPTPIGTEATELAAREQMIPQGVPGDSFSGSEYNLFSPEGKIDPVKRDVLMAENQTKSYEKNNGVDVKGDEINEDNPGWSERWAETKKNWKDAEGAGEKFGVVMDFMTDPANKLIVAALGGTATAVFTYLDNKALEEDQPQYTDYPDIVATDYATRGLENVNPVLSKDGGIIGLAQGGEPVVEMDYRGGGFIPVGAQERADDVPARLSKNEFVMTADAVRAAGGGSINLGSQRMYDLMNRLEAA